ncbi:hypothetical protein BUALT_BualtUnG0005200 [Buddleja alternifolia]|uniref:RNase H type-1 domain-containing protein n=1 Tax=Buddleja alternifolia TaxID=168488 RepID=A0AAV6W5N6_9LAMI|nr:hypothetical protein BUALT_BualtUnG0005200 [Buddleja alternifolia]
MEEEIERMRKSLTISEDEEVLIPNSVSMGDFNNKDLVLVGPVLAPRPYNVEAFKTTFTGILHPLEGLTIRKISVDRFVLIFNHSVDRQRALEDDFDNAWRFTGFYGAPDASKKQDIWKLLIHLSHYSHKPWLVASDFNEVLFNHEHLSSSTRPAWQIQDFRETVQTTGLSYLGFIGNKFTWTNGRDPPHKVRVRLDRARASRAWINRFPHFKAFHLPLIHADHSPILIKSLPPPRVDSVRQGRGRRPFRFEAWWIRSDECGKVIRESWNSSSESDPQAKVYQNLEECHRWIPRPNTFKLITNCNLLPPDAMVFTLIVPHSRLWNEELIQNVFWPPDATSILSIPLARYSCPDSLIWHYSKNGLFSVKSAYHVARSLITEDGPSRSSSSSADWRFIWGAKLPHKIRVFIWRVSAATIPSFWSCPSSPCIKLNFDGAMFNQENGIGVGVIARNSFGACIAWLTRFYPNLDNSEYAEALGAREALELAIRKGWESITIEGDCGVVLSKIGSPDTDYSSIASLISDIKLLSFSFSCICFSQVGRSGNCAAHALARLTGGI